MTRTLRWLTRIGMVALVAPAGCDRASPPQLPPPAAALSGPACSFELTPDDLLLDAVEAAAERWGRATGCDIHVGPAGVPVVFADRIRRPDGKTEAAGMTTEARDRVLIHVRGTDWPGTVLHELGHVLGGEHVASDGILSGEAGHTDVIDAPALESVCTRLPCGAFSPEG